MDLTLISIVTGLGLTELLLTFYRLVRDQKRVTWDPLPLAWAALVLIAVVNYWWGIRAIMARASDWTTGAFMLTMISPIFLFLTCAAALPSVQSGGRTDMRAGYAGQRSAFLLFFLGYQCGNWILDLTGLAGPQPLIVPVVRAIATAALLVALLARSRKWDWAALVVIASALAVRLVTQMAR